MNELITKVGIELLGQLKKGENIEAGVNRTEEEQVEGQGEKMDEGIEEEGSKCCCICLVFASVSLGPFAFMFYDLLNNW